MADAQLEGLVQHMLDGGADDATIREAVQLYQAKHGPGLGPDQAPEYRKPGITIGDIATGRATPWQLAGQLGSEGLQAASLMGAAGPVGRLLTAAITKPAASAATVGGVLKAAASPAAMDVYGSLPGVGRSVRTIQALGKLKSALYPELSAAGAPAEQAASSASQLVLTPAEFAQRDAVLQLAKARASMGGTLNAAKAMNRQAMIGQLLGPQ